MVDLPLAPDRIVTSTAPTSSVSRQDIIGSTDLMAGALNKVADAQMEIATKQAKEQAADDLQNQKVTLNADGSVSVANPANSLIFGRAGDAYHAAVTAGTIAQHSNAISTEMNDIHQKYPTDPAAFKAAADAWKDKYLEQHGGGEVGLAIQQQADQAQTQHYNSITNTSANIDITNQQKSITANINDQKNTLQGLARQPGGTYTPEFKAAVARMDAGYDALGTNPLFRMPKDQIELEKKNFHGLLQGEALVAEIDDTFTKKGKGDAQKALNEGVLQNPNLSETDRNRLYTHGMARLQYLTADSKEKIDAGRKAVSEIETNVANGTLKPTDPIIGMEIKAARDRGDPESANRILAATTVRMNLTGIQTLPQTVQAEVLGIKPTGAVNAAIPVEGRALLDHIAGTESNGRYDVRYSGATFQGYGDHPRVAEPITSGPDVGKTSSAAGRYQFIAPTWDQQAKKLGLKDFSPANQDTAAWDLAQTEYKSKTGADLLTVLKSGDQAAIAAVPGYLSGQWSSLPGGRQPARGGTPFVSNLAAADQAMHLTPEEKSFYQRHLSNLTGPGGVDNPDGTRSTLFQTTAEHDGKFYTIPTVYDGKILWDPNAPDKAAAAKARAAEIGWDKFPSYKTEAEAEARYQQMHAFIEKDTTSYKASLARPRAIAPAANGGPGFTAADLKANPFLGSAYVRTMAADESLRVQAATQAAGGVTKAVDNGLLPRPADVALVNQTAQQYPEKFGPTAETMNGKILGGALAAMEQPQRDAVIAEYRAATNGQDQHHMNVAAAALDQYGKSEKALAEHPFQEAATRGWIAPVAPIDPSQPDSIPAALAQRVAASQRIAAMNHSPAPPVLGKDEMPQLQGALEGPAGAGVLSAIATSLKPDDMHTLLGQKGFVDSLTAMQSSLDPVKMSTANAVADKLWQQNAALAEQALGKGSLDKLQAWQALKGAFSPEELAKRLNQSDDPATAKARTDARTAAEKETEKLSAADVTGKLTKSWFFGPSAPADVPDTANLPGGSLAGAALTNDYKATYTQLRSMGVPADKASDKAVERLKSTWGPSEAAGNQLMRLPPEHFNKPIEGAPNWLGDQLHDFVEASEGPARGKVVSDKHSPTRQRWDVSGLVADGRTESEVSNGQPPSYHVAIKRPGGEIDVLPNRITFDASKYMAKHEADLRSRLSGIEAVRTGTTGMPLP
jgi:muramidase (phage lysozyme)